MGITLGLSLIVKDEIESLKRLFESIENIDFDYIFVAQTIENKPIYDFLKNKGVTIGYFEWNDNYSDARKYSFDNCPTDYVIWLDSDDVVENGEKLRKVFNKAIEKESNCIYLPYYYRYDDNGYLNTDMWRERIIKKGLFEWEGFVHETLETKEKSIPYFSDEIIIRHNIKDKSDSERFERNKRISEIQYKLEKTNRTIYSYALALADCGKDGEALRLLNELDPKKFDYQDNFQLEMFRGNLFLNIKFYEEAINHYQKASEYFPEVGEPYFKKAEAYNYLLDWKSVIKNCEKGFNLNMPDRVRFPVNRLNYTLRPAKLYIHALASIGQLDKAIGIIQYVYNQFPKDKWIMEKRVDLLKDKMIREVSNV